MTLRFAVIGSPVAHSRSPAIQNAAFLWCGIDGIYGIREADEADVDEVFRDLRSGALAGVNVTMPLKRAAHDGADRLTEVAARAGAVNTLWYEDGVLWGHSTDVDGVGFAWDHAGWSDEAVYVLGAGGAAAAALLAFEGRPVTVAARRRDAAAGLVERLGVRASVVDWATPVPGAVIVNATPIGMHGENLPDGLVAAAGGLLDMVYGHGITPARRQAAEVGVPSVDGATMLVGQGAASFRLWTGAVAPDAVMLSAFAGTESGRKSQEP